MANPGSSRASRMKAFRLFMVCCGGGGGGGGARKAAHGRRQPLGWRRRVTQQTVCARMGRHAALSACPGDGCQAQAFRVQGCGFSAHARRCKAQRCARLAGGGGIGVGFGARARKASRGQLEQLWKNCSIRVAREWLAAGGPRPGSTWVPLWGPLPGRPPPRVHLGSTWVPLWGPLPGKSAWPPPGGPPGAGAPPGDGHAP